ncbi:uncharacterized protein LOC142582405 [Dermacentor variabilis]|uniref:uncharacterized protein LOC142582405 n=1 Tax=Dermacentor variabilis TaxID=34621 RepID=UPI003F5BE885
MSSEVPNLWRYCSQLNQLCPDLLPVGKVYADLRWSGTPYTARRLDHSVGCTHGSGSGGTNGGRVCHVFACLSAWNEFLMFINMELREAPPGELSLTRMRGTSPSSPCRWITRVRHAAVLVHWLLTVHRCVRRVELDVLVVQRSGPFSALYYDALHHSANIRELTLLGRHSNRDATKRLVASIAHMKRLERLDCTSVDFSEEASFAEYIATTDTLKALTLISVEAHPGCLPVLLKALVSNSSITELSANIEYLSGDSDDAFCSYLKKTAILKRLSLSKPSFSQCSYLGAVFEAMSQNKSVSKLYLVGFTLTTTDAWSFARLLDMNRALKIIGFKYCEWCLLADEYLFPLSRKSKIGESARTERTLWNVLPLAVALEIVSGLEEIMLNVSAFNATEQLALLCAVASNSTIKKVKFDAVASDTISSLCEALRITGTKDRVDLGVVDTCVGDLVHVQTSCKEASELRLEISPDDDAEAILECLRMLPSCTQLVEMDICLEEEPLDPKACLLLSECIVHNQSLRQLCVMFFASGDAVVLIIKALSCNDTLEDITIENWKLDDESGSLLASLVANSKFITHFVFRTLCFVGHIPLVFHLAKRLECNTTLVSLHIEENRNFQEQMAAAMDIVRRNAALVDCAAHFVMGSRNKRYAEAFERVARSPALVARVQEQAEGQCLRRAKDAIQETMRYLRDMESFMKVAGVVKDCLSWDESVEYRQRLDVLPFDCWLHVRQYIKVADVLRDEPLATHTSRPKRGLWPRVMRGRRSNKAPRVRI